MFGLSSTTTGLRKLTQWRFRTVATAWADELEPLILERLRDAAPVGKGPEAGRLRDSMRGRRQFTATGLRLEFRSDASYVSFVLKGTKAHVIRPRSAKVLYWQDGGGGHFARMVHHPGTKANPFVSRAVDPLRPLIAARMASAVVRAMDKA